MSSKKNGLLGWVTGMSFKLKMLIISLAILSISSPFLVVFNEESGAYGGAMQAIVILGLLYLIIALVYLLYGKNEKMKMSHVQFEEGEKRMSAIANSAHDGIIMMDYLGSISYWNPAAVRIFGYTSEEAIGQQLHTLIAPERYHSAYQKAFKTFQNTGRGSAVGRTIDLEALRKDNCEISVQLALSAIPMTIGWNSVGVIRDITRQKQIEAEIIKSKEIAEDATKAKSDFLANMSHEIRTPMNAIIGFSNLVMKTEMTPRQRDYIGKIDSSANSLLSVINDILDFSKIEAGKLEMESVGFRLDEVINNIVGMVSVKASEKSLELLSTISKDVPYDLVGDSMRLGQVLINLVNNAIKFTEMGHILIRVELVEKDDAQCRVKFTISDSGIGMTKEQMNKLFAAFSQADSSVTRKYGGTGLGLTICKRLVEMMEGEISVDSEYGIGSEFAFTAKFMINLDVKDERNFNIEKFRNMKVLIVDDNDMASEILKEQTTAFGMHAKTVNSGEKAIIELEKESANEPYDLVFMDWRMPGMDGLEAAKSIFENKNIGHVPMTIMVSAFGREEVFQKAEKLGVDAFLIKPINQSLLLDTVMEVFGINQKPMAKNNSKNSNAANSSFAIKNAKILLVEDNLLNQEVATEILKMAGVKVDIASNGKEAVEILESKGAMFYDVVLMDIQMPVMGGYEATRLLRSKDSFTEQPIIAMTAHAMHGVKEECLEAGMNDYVSKPIVPNNLYEVLSKWVKPKVDLDNSVEATTHANGADADADSKLDAHSDTDTHALSDADSDAKLNADKDANANTNSQVDSDTDTHALSDADSNILIELPADFDGIDIEDGLSRVGENRKFYRKMLDGFYLTHLNAAVELEKLVSESRYEDALSLCHMIKGVAGNISLTKIQAVCASIENNIKKNEFSDIPDLVEQLKVAFQYFENAMKPLHDGINEAASALPIVEEISKTYSQEDLVQIAIVLEQLDKCISKNMVSANRVLEELVILLGNNSFVKEINLIRNSISNFDFDKAKEPLQAITVGLSIAMEKES